MTKTSKYGKKEKEKKRRILVKVKFLKSGANLAVKTICGVDMHPLSPK
jgi:hypothetical protein